MESDDPGGRKPALLSLRSAFILTSALLVAMGAGGLLYAAHRSITQAVLGAGAAFAAAATFLNWVIELRAAVAATRTRACAATGRRSFRLSRCQSADHS